MSSHLEPVCMTFYSDTAVIAKGSVIKGGSDKSHVAKASAATDKNIGIAQNAVSAIGDKIEVAVDGGSKGLLGGTVAFGDYLTSDSNGALVATTTNNDKIVAQAFESGVAGDLISVQVSVFNY